MPLLSEITEFLKALAPPSLAEEWDNTGLLVGNEDAVISSAMTCLTLTPNVAAEAIQQKSQLIVSHHPILFRPIQRITGADAEGRMLLELIAARVNVYSPHTRYDSAVDGINQQLAQLLELTATRVLRPKPRLDDEPPEDLSWGSGRMGSLPEEITLQQFNQRVKQCLDIEHVQFVGNEESIVRHVAIACGAAAEFLRDAKQLGCDVLLTGEARFHACLEANSLDISLVLPGHYATERPAMEHMALTLSDAFTDLNVWASRSESDPLEWD